ncbi:MAG: RES family NAD+ phosphorylase [Thioalkalivibrio sp.]|nr:RES family NAD+ phosphorylase [Thioalkalivibrio sp.]
MSTGDPPGPPPSPPANLHARGLTTVTRPAGTVLYRIHRTVHQPLYFGREGDPRRRQRWDSPDASYGVCYLAEHDHIAFAETLLRDLSLHAVPEAELRIRSCTRIHLRSPLRLVAMHGGGLRPNRADASVVHGPYPNTWAWSKELWRHPDAPDGIRYRARHDDSGLSIALFERAAGSVERLETVELLDPRLATTLGRWLDRYKLGLST